MLLCGVCGASTAQEIAPFKLTGFEGYNTLRYVQDNVVTTQPGSGPTSGSRSRSGMSDLREELFVMTHSYVYHPNLLSLDVGGGPVLQRGTITTDTADGQSRGALYNFTARGLIMRDKPYQGTVFFEHVNPTLSVSPGQAMTQENTRYGAGLTLLAPVTPMPLYLDVSHSQIAGRSADRIIDDQTDRLGLRTSRSFGALGSTQIQYNTTQQTSMSGSPNLPIQGSSSSNQGLNVDSRFQFGADQQYSLINLITLSTQDYTLQGQDPLPERKDSRVFLDLRGRHSAQLQSFGSVNHTSNSQGEIGSVVNSAVAGLNYAPRPDLGVAIGVHADDSQAKQSEATTRGVDGTVRYQRALPIGLGQVSYGVRYDQREQKAAAAQTGVIGERITMAGVVLVALSRQHVVAGSLVVSNATRTQTFVEGRDYTLTLVGAETRLQRLIGGAIVDGQDLLLDYAYEVGGSYSYNQLDQNLNLNWGLMNLVNTYFRHSTADPRLVSGLPSFPLNVVQSNLYGVRADVPLKLRLETTLGGSIERENRRETIAPFRREAEEVYVQTEDPLFGTGGIRVSTRRTRVEYENSAINVNLQAYDLRYWVRLRLGIQLSADLSHESDTGSLIPRQRTIASAKALWRYRKLSITADVGRTVENQGGSSRARALAQFMVRREF